MLTVPAPGHIADDSSHWRRGRCADGYVMFMFCGRSLSWALGDPGGRSACYNRPAPAPPCVFSFIRDQNFQYFWDSISASLSTVEFPAHKVCATSDS